MQRATEEAFKTLAGRVIVNVNIEGESVELGVPDSEGWRLVIGTALDERSRPALTAHWEPGMRRRPHGVPLRRLFAHRLRLPARAHARTRRRSSTARRRPVRQDVSSRA